MQNPKIIENLLSRDECDMVLGMCIKLIINVEKDLRKSFI
jgi:hypothetical protein